MRTPIVWLLLISTLVFSMDNVRDWYLLYNQNNYFDDTGEIIDWASGNNRHYTARCPICFIVIEDNTWPFLEKKLSGHIAKNHPGKHIKSKTMQHIKEHSINAHRIKQ